MAWNTPRTFTTGEVITSTIMNTNIRSNLNATAVGVASAAGDTFFSPLTNAISPISIGSKYQLMTVNAAGNAPAWAEGYAPIDIVTTETEVVNTAAETTIYTSSDIGGTLLGTTGAIKLVFLLSYLNNSGVTRSFTLTTKIDSTTILTPINGGSQATSATRRLAWITYILQQKGSASSQQHMVEYYTAVNDVMALSAIQPASSLVDETTSAIDLSSGTHNIVITVQHSAAAATISVILRFAGLFMMRPV